MLPRFAVVLSLFSIPAFAAVSVTSPINGAQVTSPITVVAKAATCSSQPTAAMGYSLDYGPTTIMQASAISALALAGNGLHVLHVKCWGVHGSADVVDAPITVVSPSSVPENVTVASNLQLSPGWTGNHDPGGGGTSTGTTALVSSPSLSGQARQFTMSLSNYGGEIFHTPFGTDTAATHFIYDAEVMLADPSNVANVEMDLNQVMVNGQTVIFGVQCDGWSGTWDYTLNTGTQTKPVDTWEHSNVQCPMPSTWTANVWHRVQIAYDRDNSGNVTYRSVVFDGAESDFIGATGSSSFALGWAATLLTNFQIDGIGASASVTAYLDNVTVFRW